MDNRCCWFEDAPPVASSRVVKQHQNVRYERPTRTPQLQSPWLQRPRKLLWVHWALDGNENRGNGCPKSKTQVQQQDNSRKQRWKRSLCCVKRVPKPQTRGNWRILFAADQQPKRKYLIQEAAHEEGRPSKHNETNGRESRDKKRR